MNPMTRTARTRSTRSTRASVVVADLTPEQAQAAFEQTGFDAVRQAVLSVPATAGQLPLESIELLIIYVEGVATRLRLDQSPEGRAQLQHAEDELKVFKATRTFRSTLAKLEERRQARQRLAVPDALANGHSPSSALVE